MSWAVVFAKHAQKDAQKLAASGLKAKAQELLAVIRKNPFQNPPPYEKLVGDLAGAYSRRINIQHRLVYEVLEAEHIEKLWKEKIDWLSEYQFHEPLIVRYIHKMFLQ